ncbi:hypothetical protein [Paraburkholderia aromaticivorans]|uniref:hypothetical protein n=1 Tax=Paraburkholderia aromaticivorans TaxID=2026199 RepID=UPI0038BD1A6A
MVLAAAWKHKPAGVCGEAGEISVTIPRKSAGQSDRNPKNGYTSFHTRLAGRSCEFFAVDAAAEFEINEKAFEGLSDGIILEVGQSL